MIFRRIMICADKNSQNIIKSKKKCVEVNDEVNLYPVFNINKEIYLQFVKHKSCYHLFVITLKGFLVLFETPKEIEMKSSPAIHAQSCGTMLFSANMFFF